MGPQSARSGSACHPCSRRPACRGNPTGPAGSRSRRRAGSRDPAAGMDKGWPEAAARVRPGGPSTRWCPGPPGRRPPAAGRWLAARRCPGNSPGRGHTGRSRTSPGRSGTPGSCCRWPPAGRAGTGMGMWPEQACAPGLARAPSRPVVPGRAPPAGPCPHSCRRGCSPPSAPGESRRRRCGRCSSPGPARPDRPCCPAGPGWAMPAGPVRCAAGPGWDARRPGRSGRRPGRSGQTARPGTRGGRRPPDSRGPRPAPVNMCRNRRLARRSYPGPGRCSRYARGPGRRRGNRQWSLGGWAGRRPPGRGNRPVHSGSWCCPPGPRSCRRARQPDHCGARRRSRGLARPAARRCCAGGSGTTCCLRLPRCGRTRGWSAGRPRPGLAGSGSPAAPRPA